MSTKKGSCPCCSKIKSIKHNMFDVNIEADICYCPICGAEISTVEAVKKYNDTMNVLLKKADYVLFVKGNPEEAYREYASILLIDDTNENAYFGRILSLIYSSKKHTSYFNDALTLLKNESTQYFRKMSDKQSYLKFVQKANGALDEYLRKLKKSLTIRKCFYDKECLEVFYARVNDALNLKKGLLDEATFLFNHYDENKSAATMNQLTSSVRELETTLVTPYRIANGDLYHLSKIKRTGEAVAEDMKNQINTHLSKYRLATFNLANKELRHIKENVFKNNTKRIVFCNISFILFILLFLGAIALGFLSYYFINNNLMFILFLIIGSVCLVSSLVLLVEFIIIATDIKKRRLKLS